MCLAVNYVCLVVPLVSHFANSKELAGEGVIVIVCCAYSLYPEICSVLFSLGITSFSANHRLGLAGI